MCPPSSCQSGSRFSAVANNPTHAARPTGGSSSQFGSASRMRQRDKNRISGGLPKTIAAFVCTPGTIFALAIANAIAGTANRNPTTARRCHVKKRAPRGNRRTNANERAKRAEQRRRGNEIRIAGVNSVIVAGEKNVPTHAPEKCQQRERKRNPQQAEVADARAASSIIVRKF